MRGPWAYHEKRTSPGIRRHQGCHKQRGKEMEGEASLGYYINGSANFHGRKPSCYGEIKYTSGGVMDTKENNTKIFVIKSQDIIVIQ